LHLAARLYYVEGMGQVEVAKFVKVSQAKVSRLLAMARARGIVRITVADYDPRERELEALLRVQFGLSSVIVIKAPARLPPADLRKSIGLFGAGAFGALIQPKDTIAVAGGRAIHALVQNIPESADKHPVVVQSMGSVDSTVNSFDSQEIGRVLARRLGGSFIAMNTPAYVQEKTMRDALLDLEQVRAVDACLSQANLAVIGVGTLDNSVFIERGILKRQDIAGLKAAGAIGEVCGRFFDAAGRECDTSWRDRVMSVGLWQLARTPQVIGVVAGADRSAAILGAIAGGFLKSLIIDEPGARALLEAAGPQFTAKTKRTRKPPVAPKAPEGTKTPEAPQKAEDTQTA
jgi:DNA-binding transcriptional regulator LsrR (DeoR family)